MGGQTGGVRCKATQRRGHSFFSSKKYCGMYVHANCVPFVDGVLNTRCVWDLFIQASNVDSARADLCAGTWSSDVVVV